MAYATTEDLERRWRALSPDEAGTAAALLDDAAAILDSMGACDVDDGLLAIVSCNMVRRAMTTDGDTFGIDGQVSDSLGWGSVLPAGELWLSAADRRMLRSGAKVGFSCMADMSHG